jgi:hypothetical protein
MRERSPPCALQSGTQLVRVGAFWARLARLPPASTPSQTARILPSRTLNTLGQVPQPSRPSDPQTLSPQLETLTPNRQMPSKPSALTDSVLIVGGQAAAQRLRALLWGTRTRGTKTLLWGTRTCGCQRRHRS